MPETSDALLGRIRKLLAKAEAAGVTPGEAEALNGKAAELMARYGIDRAMLAAAEPGTDKITDVWLDMDQPYARDKVTLCISLARALRCTGLYTDEKGWDEQGNYPMKVYKVHVYGYQSDLDRLQILFTSLLLQSAHGLARSGRRKTADKRTWIAGFTVAVTDRVNAAEQNAAADRDRETPAGTSVALVLADRSTLVENAFRAAYPDLRYSTRTLSGSGYNDGHAAGMRADIGTTRISQQRALNGTR